MAKKTRITPILDEKTNIAESLRIDIKSPQVPLPTAEELNVAVSQLTKTPLATPTTAEPTPAAKPIVSPQKTVEEAVVIEKPIQSTVTKSPKSVTGAQKAIASSEPPKPMKGRNKAQKITNPAISAISTTSKAAKTLKPANKTSTKSVAITPSVIATPQRGRPIGEKQRIKFTTALEESLVIKLKKAAIDRRKTAADLIEEFIEQYL